jgi:hypothetical protein
MMKQSPLSRKGAKPQRITLLTIQDHMKEINSKPTLRLRACLPVGRSLCANYYSDETIAGIYSTPGQ